MKLRFCRIYHWKRLWRSTWSKRWVPTFVSYIRMYQCTVLLEHALVGTNMSQIVHPSDKNKPWTLKIRADRQLVLCTQESFSNFQTMEPLLWAISIFVPTRSDVGTSHPPLRKVVLSLPRSGWVSALMKSLSLHYRPHLFLTWPMWHFQNKTKGLLQKGYKFKNSKCYLRANQGQKSFIRLCAWAIENFRTSFGSWHVRASLNFRTPSTLISDRLCKSTHSRLLH